MKPSTTAYRIDIEGLRALAVLAVILNHVRDGLLNSGYLGVDIFFVISGYVITASLQTSRDVPIGAFLLAFYTRRIKRIAPALILCVGISSAALVLCDPDPAVSFKTGIFALLGLANVYLYLEHINYFASDTAFNAFMHTWSLGVEEQFYLILPVLILLVRPGRRLAGAVLALSLLSLLLFILLHKSDPQGSFYLIHTRFWELGAGAAFAAWSFGRRKTVARSALLTWQTAFLVVVIAFLAIRGIDQRLSTLIIVASTLAVIGSPDRSVLLTNPVAKAIGQLSYSLYLWHWPLLVLLRLSQETHWVIWPIYAAAVVGAALLSFHVVENPLRHKSWSRHAGASLIYGGLASGTMIGVLYGGLATLTHSNAPHLQSEAGKAYWEQPFCGFHPASRIFQPVWRLNQTSRGVPKPLRIALSRHSPTAMPRWSGSWEIPIQAIFRA
jgi:peptidoglycan/LPS O-acetylase OafA/YrhL